jgi:hypothetical protein
MLVEDFKLFKRNELDKFTYNQPIEEQKHLLWEISYLGISRQFTKLKLRILCRYYRIKCNLSDNKYQLITKLFTDNRI